MIHQRLLGLIIAAYLGLAILYSVITPLFEASDELWHYPMVKYLADHGLQLPPQNPEAPGPWRQEGSQPPLYYLLAAVLTSGVDTSDMEFVRRINPHADIGVIRPDGNVNMIVHRPDAEAFPWSGTTLAVHIARFFSVLLGAGTVLVSYQLAREVFPDEPAVALGAAALTAFLPMFLFISGSVNNDNLSNLLGNLLTLQVVRLLKTDALPSSRAYALLGVTTGAGLLAKLNLGFFIPLIAGALAIVSLRRRNWRPLLIGGLISGGLTIAIAGWWYLRNWQLYGDPTGLNMFLQLVGRRAVPANLAQLWSERHSFTQAYWGFFGGVNVALPDAIYWLLNLVGGAGLVGALTGFIAAIFRPPPRFRIHWLAASITLVWPAVTLISYLRWTAETPASQGRLVFGALSSISLWMAAGLVWWLPRRAHAPLLAAAAGIVGVIAALTPFLVIAPAYALPDPIPTSAPQTVFIEPNGGGQIGLQNSRVHTTMTQPESYVQLELDWQIAAPVGRDWSLFVHLVTPDDVIIGQRDVYPAGGKLATSDLTAGFAWSNPVAVWVPSAAYAPMSLTVVVGWYHLSTGERMVLTDGQESLVIGQVDLLPRRDPEGLSVPNPIRVNFEDQIELVGYQLSDLSPEPGEAVELTLYWRGLRPLQTDYKVFANILNPTTLVKQAASDGMPVRWQRPTTTWKPGEIIEDLRTLAVNPDAPPGIYELELGLYQEAPDGTFPRLRVVTPDGGMADNFIYLSRVKVSPRP